MQQFLPFYSFFFHFLYQIIRTVYMNIQRVHTGQGWFNNISHYILVHMCVSWKCCVMIQFFFYSNLLCKRTTNQTYKYSNVKINCIMERIYMRGYESEKKIFFEIIKWKKCITYMEIKKTFLSFYTRALKNRILCFLACKSDYLLLFKGYVWFVRYIAALRLYLHA